MRTRWWLTGWLILCVQLSAGTYTVQTGDSLSTIAASELGDADKWQELATLNGINPPYKLQIGQKLELPQQARVIDRLASLDGWFDGFEGATPWLPILFLLVVFLLWLGLLAFTIKLSARIVGAEATWPKAFTITFIGFLIWFASGLGFGMLPSTMESTGLLVTLFLIQIAIQVWPFCHWLEIGPVRGLICWLLAHLIFIILFGLVFAALFFGFLWLSGM